MKKRKYKRTLQQTIQICLNCTFPPTYCAYCDPVIVYELLESKQNPCTACKKKHCGECKKQTLWNALKKQGRI